MRSVAKLLCLCMVMTAVSCAKPRQEAANPVYSRGYPPLAPVANPGADRTEVLIFTGESVWMPEVGSIEHLLYSHHVTYEEADSQQLNGMDLDQIARYALLIVPGGDAPTMAASLTQKTRARLREAVQVKGLNYMGLCAGAWAAVAPAPAPGENISYGFGVVDGPVQKPSFLEKKGLHFAMTETSFPDGSKRELLWYGGPTTPDIPGGVVAKYPDGTPAVTQLRSGKGYVLIMGVHPTATQAIFDALGLRARDGTAFDLAWTYLESALRGESLPAFGRAADPVISQ